MFMKNFIFRLLTVLSLLTCTYSAHAKENSSDSIATVAILAHEYVTKGHSYTGKAVVTVRYRNGGEYILRYEKVTIDYGLETKYFNLDGIEIEYKSTCERLDGDIDAKNIIRNYFGGSKVAYILVEILVKEWN